MRQWGERILYNIIGDDVMGAKTPMKTIYKENIMKLFLAKVRIQ